MPKKQEKSTLPLLFGAIGFGIVAALLAMFYLNAREAQLKAKYEQDKAAQVMVVVAKSDLRKGQEINAQYFSQRPVPRNFVHDDAVSPAEFERYLGQALTTNLGKGKTLLKSFMDEDFPRDFSDIIPPGKRAITVTVDDVNSIGGFLRPGNRVDIYVNIPFSTSGFNPALFAAAREAGSGRAHGLRLPCPADRRSVRRPGGGHPAEQGVYPPAGGAGGLCRLLRPHPDSE